MITLNLPMKQVYTQYSLSLSIAETLEGHMHVIKN